MNELEFRKHLKDLAHGKHNPAEHDWGPQSGARKPAARKAHKSARSRRKKAA